MRSDPPSAGSAPSSALDDTDRSAQGQPDAVVPRAEAQSYDLVEEHQALGRLQRTLLGDDFAEHDDLRVGRYRLGRRIGAGGMGVVYEASDPSLNRRVAIKLVRPRSTTDAERISLEARALARLSHPNVVEVFDAGMVKLPSSDRPTAFVAMAFVDGCTLAAWVLHRRSWREILDVFLQCGAGLADAHRRGVIHGDFKPDNVLVDEAGTARVCDFGLAQILEPSDSGAPTDLRALGGTQGYLAPELSRGAPVSPSSDQFAFAVTLQRALARVCGQSPEPGDANAKPSLPVLTAPVPRQLIVALRRGLQEDPRQRWPSMESMCAALRRAGKPSPIQRLGLRHVAVALGAVGLGAVMWPSAAGVPACETPGPAPELLGQLDELVELTPPAADAAARAAIRRRIDDLSATFDRACAAPDVGRAQQTMACIDQGAQQIRQRLHWSPGPRSGRFVLGQLASWPWPPPCLGPSVATTQDLDDQTVELFAMIEASADAEFEGRLDEAQRGADEVLRLAQQLNHPELLLAGHARASAIAHTRGELSSALRHGEQTYDNALAANRSDLAASAASKAMLIAGMTANEPWEPWWRHALAALRRTDTVEPWVAVAGRAAEILMRRGRHHEALAQLGLATVVEASITTEAGVSGDPELRLRIDTLHGMVLRRMGEADAAVEQLRKALDTSLSLYGSNTLVAVPVRHELVLALRAAGRFDAALALLDQSLALQRATLETSDTNLIGTLVERAALLGDLDRPQAAAATLAEARAAVGPGTPNSMRVVLLANHGLALLELGSLREAEQVMARARVLLDESDPVSWRTRTTVLLNLVELRRRQGDRRQARADLREAVATVCPHLEAGVCQALTEQVDALAGSTPSGAPPPAVEDVAQAIDQALNR